MRFHGPAFFDAPFPGPQVVGSRKPVKVNQVGPAVHFPFELPDPLIDNKIQRQLPRPYPGFQPFWFKANASGGFDLSQVEKLEITVGQGLPRPALSYNLEVEAVWLKKR